MVQQKAINKAEEDDGDCGWADNLSPFMEKDRACKGVGLIWKVVVT